MPMNDLAEVAATAQSATLLERLESVLSLAPGSGLTAVARQLGTSRRSLQRACAAAAIDFQSVRARVRLARAESLLGDSDMKLASVAGEIGFASTAHFIAWFRRHRGMTPTAWRTLIA